MDLIEKKKLDKEYLKLAIGFMISTLTTPLLMVVDTSVVGTLTNPVYIGGVALGSTIFNTIYWIFGFLRVSTSGYSAKAFGSKNIEEKLLSLIRPMVVSVVIGLIFFIFQDAILYFAKYFYKPTPEVTEQMEIYYKILIIGAPFVLLNYTCLGWIMGRKKIRECLILQLMTNLMNIVLDIYFVMFLKQDVAGVAYATLISQVTTTILSLYIIFTENKKINMFDKLKEMKMSFIFSKEVIKEILKVKTDLIIRTICLLIATNMFMSKSSEYGEIGLAGNSILFQIQYLMSYCLDGLGNASSVMIGSAIGKKSKNEVDWIIRKTCVAGLKVAFIISSIFFVINKPLISIFTNNIEVVNYALEYKNFLLIFPLVINIGLVYYGLYTGALKTHYIRNSMLKSIALFLIAYYLVVEKYGNNGLWLSFILFSYGRSIFLYLYTKRFTKEIYTEISKD